MSHCVDHIIRHDFFELDDREAVMQFLKKTITQIKEKLYIKCEIPIKVIDFEEDPDFIPEYSFEIPSFDYDVFLCKGFWIISASLSLSSLFTKFYGEFTIRNDIFDIARALGQNEAWHCSEYNSTDCPEFNYHTDDFYTWIKIMEKRHGVIEEFDEFKIDDFIAKDSHGYYSNILHDTFDSCQKKMAELHCQFPGWNIVRINPLMHKYTVLHNKKGLFLADHTTGHLLLEYPVDDIFENLNGAGVVMTKNGKSAFFDNEGVQKSDFVDGVWKWKWIPSCPSLGIEIYNEQAGLKYPII